jgi:hypothetical protein
MPACRPRLRLACRIRNDHDSGPALRCFEGDRPCGIPAADDLTACRCPSRDHASGFVPSATKTCRRSAGTVPIRRSLGIRAGQACARKKVMPSSAPCGTCTETLRCRAGSERHVLRGRVLCSQERTGITFASIAPLNQTSCIHRYHPIDEHPVPVERVGGGADTLPIPPYSARRTALRPGVLREAHLRCDTEAVGSAHSLSTRRRHSSRRR